jgi:hypothetical protein
VSRPPEREQSAGLVQIGDEEEDVKPVIPDDDDDMAAPAVDADEEDRSEVAIKDWKPDVDVTYKGELQFPLPGIRYQGVKSS